MKYKKVYPFYFKIYNRKERYCIENKKKIIHYIEKEIVHPKNIDCIGVVFSSGRAIESKCYRFTPGTVENETVNFCAAKNDINSREYFRVISADNLNYFQILHTFVTAQNIHVSTDIINEVCKIASKRDLELKIRLSQLGAQNIGTDKEILKAYFSFRKFKSKVDVLGEKQRFSDIQDILNNIENKVGLTNAFLYLLKDIGKVVEVFGYYPSLFGINCFVSGAEYKLYFELFEPNQYFSKIEEHTYLVLQEISKWLGFNLQDFSDFNALFLNCGFFLRGFAFSSEERTPIVRLYYAPTSRFV